MDNYDLVEQEVRRKARQSFRRDIRRAIPNYSRARHLPALIYFPAGWLDTNSVEISNAIIRRLKIAIYQQRQAKEAKHYTYSLRRYMCLLTALGAEMRAAKLLTASKLREAA